MSEKVKREAVKRKNLFSGLTGNVMTLGLVSMLTDMSSEMIYPLLPIFLTSVLGVGVAFLGVIEGVAESTASILKLFSGWFSDRLRRRKSLVLFGYGLSSLARPFLALVTAGWHVLLLRFLDRVGKGVRTSPRDALIADSVSAEVRGKAYGFHRSLDNLGAVIGPLLASLLLPLLGFNYRYLFLLATVPGILAVLVLRTWVREMAPAQTKARVQISLRPLKRRFKLFLLVVILFTLGNSSDAFLLLRARDIGIRVELLPVLWIVLHLVKTVGGMAGGILSDRIGRQRVIVAGWMVYALIYVGFAYAHTPLHIWGLFALYGLYYALTEGAERALVADLVPGELRGTAFGAYNFAIGIGALPSSVIMGIIWQRYGAAAAFSFGATLAILAAFLLLVLIPAGIGRKGK